MKKLMVVLMGSIVFAACTDNSKARYWGGTEEIALKPNEILINVTWKSNEMWILTKDTTTGTSYFREKSSLGLLEGTVIFK